MTAEVGPPGTPGLAGRIQTDPLRPRVFAFPFPFPLSPTPLNPLNVFEHGRSTSQAGNPVSTQDRNIARY